MSITYGTRLRYSKSGVPNVLVTRETFMVVQGSELKHFRGYIDTTTNKWVIRDEKTSDAIVEGTGTSLHKIKIKIKDQLAKLGVGFEEEFRKPKGYKELADGKFSG